MKEDSTSISLTTSCSRNISHHCHQEFSHADILFHYPDDVSATTSAFKDIPNFCFPDLETPLPLQLPAGEEGGGGSGAGSASSSSSSSSGMENFTFILTDQDGGRVFGVCLRFLPPGDGQRFGIKVRRRFLSRCLKLSLSVCLFV